MILPRVVQPAIIKIPAFFALRCEGAGIHSRSDVEYARIANATDDPNIPRLNVPRKWADYIHGFFYPDHCASILMVLLYSSLGWRNLCSQQSHCIHCSLFLSEKCGARDNNTKNLCAMYFISTSASASMAHGTHFEQIRLMKHGVVEWEAQESLNNEHSMVEQTRQVKFTTDRRLRKR